MESEPYDGPLKELDSVILYSTHRFLRSRSKSKNGNRSSTKPAYGIGGKNMKVVVFGGSGFIGSHVSDDLTARGYEVRIFDIKKSGDLKEGQEMIIGDILDEVAVEGAVDGCDVVYHFAGLADLDSASKRPKDTISSTYWEQQTS